jgi:hypothetical protein
MDDICDSLETNEEARQLTRDVDEVLTTKGGFAVKEWISNCNLDEENQSSEKQDVKFDGEKSLTSFWT